MTRPGHYVVGHGNGGLDETLLHRPLVVRYPDGIDAPEAESEVATLTRFPAVVNAVREGRTGTFVPSGPVFAATTGLDGPMRATAESFVDDLEPHERAGDAVFEPGPETGTVRKTFQVGSEWRSQLVRGARTAYEAETETTEAAAAVEALTDAGISDAGGDVSDDVAERLSDLGYA